MTAFIDFYELALADVKAGDVIPVPLFPIGDWKSAKYPSLPLTRDLADELIANFEAGILGTEPVLDSSGKHDTSAPAAAWFKRLHVEPTKDGGEMLFGDAELTDVGAEDLNAGRYKYDSVEIGPVVMNDSGETVPNVFRSATLTNTPVLRMLPPVLDAADVIAAGEPVTILCSEVTLADAVPDPVAALCDKIDSLLAELSSALKGKAGIPAIRTMMREVSTKARAHALTEDPDGNPVVPDPASSDGSSHPAKAGEGHPVTLDEGDPVPKGSDPMNPKLTKALKLSEDATDEAVEAAVVQLAEDRDAEKKRADDAVAKLAEVEKSKRDAEVAAKLDELIAGGHVLPGQKDTWLQLAEDSPASFDAMAEQAKHAKSIELGETGDGSKPESEVSPAEAIALKASEISETRKVDLAEATDIALAENPELKAAYLAALGNE